MRNKEKNGEKSETGRKKGIFPAAEYKRISPPCA
jgi:hypothetical protein